MAPLSIAGCGGALGTGVDAEDYDRELERRYYGVNALYEDETLSFTVGGLVVGADPGNPDADTTAAFGDITGSTKFASKSLVPVTVRNADGSVTYVTQQVRTTSDDRQLTVAWGTKAATKVQNVPFEPMYNGETRICYGLLDDSDTREFDVYLLAPGQEITDTTPVFTPFQHDPANPLKFIRWKKLPAAMGGETQQVKIVHVLRNTRTVVPEYTRTVTLRNRYAKFVFLTRHNGEREIVTVEQRYGSQ